MIIGNKTLHCLIRSVITIVITKLNSHCVVSNFINQPYDYRLNWTPLGPITIVNQSDR